MILEYCPSCCRMTETRYGHCLDCGLARRVFTKPCWPRPGAVARPLMYLVGGLIIGALVGPCMGCSAATDISLDHGNDQPTQYEVRVSPQWSPDGMTAVETASDDWQTTTGVILNTTISDDPCPPASACFHIAPQDGPMTSSDCHDYEPNIVGCTYDDAREIAVDSALTGDVQVHVIRHEIGHALGLRHTVELDSVMYYSTAGSPTITGVDVAQYDYLRGGPAGGFTLDTEH